MLPLWLQVHGKSAASRAPARTVLRKSVATLCCAYHNPRQMRESLRMRSAARLVVRTGVEQPLAVYKLCALLIVKGTLFVIPTMIAESW